MSSGRPISGERFAVVYIPIRPGASGLYQPQRHPYLTSTIVGASVVIMLDPDLSPARNRTLLALMLRSLDQDPSSAHSSSDMLLTTARGSLVADQPMPTTFASTTSDGQVTSTTSIHPSRFFAQSHPLSMAKHICAICGDRASGKHYGVYR